MSPKTFVKNLATKVSPKGVSSPEHVAWTEGFVSVWLVTTTVMWFYVVFCLVTLPNTPVPIGGAIFSFLHTLAPIVRRLGASLAVTGLLVSLTGLAFQALFCVFTGGIDSPAAIWFALHPVLLSFFGSKRIIGISVGFNMLLVIALSIGKNSALLPNSELNPHFRQLMAISSYIGLDVLIAAFTIAGMMVQHRFRAESEKQNSLITNLVRILSHDLANPLTIIQGSATQLPSGSEGKPDPGSRIRRAADQMNNIICGVRTWMAGSEHKLALEEEDIEIAEIFDTASFVFSQRLAEKNLRLVMPTGKECADLVIRGDKTAVIHQVFDNILSNAIKFSYPKSDINVGAKRLDDGRIAISVRDFGVGIPAEMQSDVFSPYIKTSTRGTNNEKGTGFGLPIVKTLVEEMGGTITLCSFVKPETGTEVTLFFRASVPTMLSSLDH